MTQKEACLVCQIADNKIPSKILYEDEQSMAVLDVNGANPGHCFIFPKNHYPIIEQVHDEEIGNMFQIANKLSSAIFEGLKVEGTNIFVANGIPAGQTVAHFMINVIPRTQNDGINLQWQPKQLDEEEMSTVELKIKEQTDKVGISSEPIPSTTFEKPKEKKESDDYETSDEDEDNLRQITRIP